jgi:hypothetical protein
VTFIEGFGWMVDQRIDESLNSPIVLSSEMRQLLSAVIFGGFELFPATGPKRLDEAKKRDRR